MPTVELPPAMPFTVQVTAVFVVPAIVAVNCCVLVTSIEAVLSFRLNEILIVTEAETDFVLSAWLVAVMLTLCGVGTIAGAV